jgi:hypothetical protein
MPIMRHPGLPDDQTIDAQDVQVHHYQASGWQIVPDEGDPPVEAPAQTSEAPADAGASDLQAEDSGSPRRRRATPKAEEE